jgi:phosphotriesterase-related protein
MARPAAAGEVQTVLGPVKPEELGIALPHEHLLLDLTCLFAEPDTARGRALARQPVALENLSWIRRNWTSNLDNLRLDDEALAVKEALEYKLDGGRAIVDVTSIGLARDPVGLQRIARATGLHVVMGCGYYVARSHPDSMDGRSEQDIEDEIVREITQGVADTGVRAGIIGELGCSWPLADSEARVLRAAARAQQRTGVAISIHPGRDQASPLQIIELLRAAGADLGRVIMGHLDRTGIEADTLRRVATSGCYLALDTFGQETWVYPLAPVDRLSDAQRVDLIRELIAEGLGRQVLVSHDVGYKHRLAAYGGSGYSHLLTTVLPHQMRRKQIQEEHIQWLLVDNPARVLQLA